MKYVSQELQNIQNYFKIKEKHYLQFLTIY